VTAGSILFRHPAGDLLIDTGKSSYFAEEISIDPFWLRWKLQFPLKPDVPLPEMLRREGEDPAKLRWAILSHVSSRPRGRLDGPAAPRAP